MYASVMIIKFRQTQSAQRVGKIKEGTQMHSQRRQIDYGIQGKGEVMATR